MSEPSRKKLKGHHEPQLALVSSKPVDEGFSFTTTNPVSPTLVDLTEFVVGRTDACRGQNRWKGAFSGRPDLVKDLFPYIKAQYVGLSKGTIRLLLDALRAWWRLFDAYDHVTPVHTAEDITDIHAALRQKAGISGAQSAKLLALVNAFRRAKGFPQLYWTSIGRVGKPAMLPEQWEIKTIHDAMKRRYFAMLDRWRDADVDTENGRDWSSCVVQRPSRTPWTAAEIHATYRGVARALGHPCPEQTVATKELGLNSTVAFQPMTLPVFGLFPSKDDVQACFYLFMLRTGWNAQTVLDIDITAEPITEHPLSPMYHQVRAIKQRSNTEQVAIGANKSELAPGNILRAIIARTKPLRDLLGKELQVLEARLDDSPGDNKLRLKVVALRSTIKSPWLFVNAGNKNGIARLMTGTYATSSRKGRWSFLASVIEQANSVRPPDKQLRTSITGSDFRDAYITFAYRNSGYSWLAAKLAAGHKSIESLKNYLRQRQWQAHSRQQVVRFTGHLWREIDNRKAVDATVLHALVQGHELTEEQRQRWMAHKDRTRVGVGCRDFTHPPEQIAPEHREGTGCRIQRCTLCPHAVVFDDSVDHLARRLAELEWLRTQISLVAWTESSFPDELDATKSVLTQFDAAIVEARRNHWLELIETGQHRPLQMEGAYE